MIDESCMESIVKSMQKYIGNLYHMTDKVRRNVDIMQELVCIDYRALSYATELITKNEYIVRKAIETNGGALQYAHKTLRNERSIALLAMRRRGFLQHVGNDLRDDGDIVSAGNSKPCRKYHVCPPPSGKIMRTYSCLLLNRMVFCSSTHHQKWPKMWTS